jgi:hypothetical protein
LWAVFARRTRGLRLRLCIRCPRPRPRRDHDLRSFLYFFGASSCALALSACAAIDETPLLDDSQQRESQQALWCPIRTSRGVLEIVVLTTDPATIGATPTACCQPEEFPYTTLGAFCADVPVESNLGVRLRYTQAESTSVTPSVGYNGYRFAARGCLIGTDPSTLGGDPAVGETCTTDDECFRELCDEVAGVCVSTCSTCSTDKWGPDCTPCSCDHGLWCNGAEIRDPHVGCMMGIAPAVDDGNSCTVSTCDEVADVVASVGSAGSVAAALSGGVCLP